MSNGDTTFHRWITRSYFRNCSTCRSYSKAHFYPYALRMIADHTECTFELLRYFLGGNRPSQTDPLTMSLLRIHAIKLETYINRGGISFCDSFKPYDLNSTSPTYSTHTYTNNNIRLQLRFMGSFRPTASIRHFHRKFNFTESHVETASRSLHDSCRSELTRQGISLP